MIRHRVAIPCNDREQLTGRTAEVVRSERMELLSGIGQNGETLGVGYFGKA